MDLVQKKILVVGLGKSGLSAARWLAGQGAIVTISDHKPLEAIDPSLVKQATALGATIESGAHRQETFLEAQGILLSPGIPLDIAPLGAARAAGIPVMGEMELAGRVIAVPIIAVTGTNGKSTATALLGDILKRAGLEVFVGGNIGTPLIELALEDGGVDVAVVEVSSFQLDTTETFKPMISLLLNISPDHLDRYPDYEAYVQSKLKIYQNQNHGSHVILNDDDTRLAQVDPSHEILVLRYGIKAQENRQAFLDGHRLMTRLPGMAPRAFPIGRYHLPGRHNLENLMGVVLAALAFDVKPKAIQEAIEYFKGLPHRLYHVGRFKGATFFNDSKATNVDAACRALMTFEGPVILIAGGRHKGADYMPLVKAARGRVKKAIFLGEARHLLAEAFDGLIPFSLAESMEDAVSKAYASAGPHDVVLFSPACSSFDMFTDYAQRGQVFERTVERLGHAP